jgi:hypothetical protein
MSRTWVCEREALTCYTEPVIQLSDVLFCNAMPYYIYKITPGPTDLLKTLEKLEQYESFKEARNRARSMRSKMAKDDNYIVKVMFADSELEAEEKLMEKREAPILREWEK